MDNGNDLNGWGRRGKDKRISSSRQYFLVDLKKKEIINLFFFSFFVLLYIRAFFTVVFSINP
jgi:hypothetical protein